MNLIKIALLYTSKAPSHVFREMTQLAYALSRSPKMPKQYKQQVFKSLLSRMKKTYRSATPKEMASMLMSLGLPKEELISLIKSMM